MLRPVHEKVEANRAQELLVVASYLCSIWLGQAEWVISRGLSPTRSLVSMSSDGLP